jgi:hypothetical protein
MCNDGEHATDSGCVTLVWAHNYARIQSQFVADFQLSCCSAILLNIAGTVLVLVLI